MPRIDLLLMDHDDSEVPHAAMRFGDTPVVSSGFAWPRCRACGGNMQFLGQIAREGSPRRHLVFMCQNRPGLCSEWDPDKGANAVVCQGVADLRPADVPAEGAVLRATRHAARILPVEAAGYDAARTAWTEAHPGQARDVLGQVGGFPAWLQDDETPACDYCRRPMRFLAQIEEGPDHATAMNFGGGTGFLFECDCGGGSGKFLWQS